MQPWWSPKLPLLSPPLTPCCFCSPVALQVNQKTTKTALIKDLAGEIERLRMGIDCLQRHLSHVCN